MRPRYDKNGNLKSCFAITFDEIPDNFEVNTILNDKFIDFSYVGIIQHLQNIKAGEEFENQKWVSREILEHMSLDYINTARNLGKMILDDRSEGKEIISSYYTIPCTYLCKHSIELKLKHCLLTKGSKNIKTHDLSKLWKELNETDVSNYNKLNNFIEEMSEVDKTDESLRYGLDNDLNTVTTTFRVDVYQIILNTMYLFNVLDEEVVFKYEHLRKEN